MYGPHGPTAYSNGPSTVEIQAEWVCEFIKYMRDNNIRYFDAQEDAEAKFGEHINELSAKTLFHESHGWYMGRNIPGKPVQALNFTVSTITLPLLFLCSIVRNRLADELQFMSMSKQQGGIPMYVRKLAECRQAGYAGYDLVKA